MEEGQQNVFLTFDDGPVPGVTDYVLDALGSKDMKATFFMVGDNIKKYPDLAKRVMEEGHSIGNHTFNHLNGWKTRLEDYIDNVNRCNAIIAETLGFAPQLFRPPYGLLTTGQAKKVLESLDIVMWNVLSGDYQKGISSQQVFNKTCKYSRSGSIVLFHDQQKTKDIIPKVLPDYLAFLESRNLKSRSL